MPWKSPEARLDVGTSVSGQGSENEVGVCKEGWDGAFLGLQVGLWVPQGKRKEGRWAVGRKKARGSLLWQGEKGRQTRVH